jgi:6-phosphogluconate dehydrogenase
MVRRLMRTGHTCVVIDRSAETVRAMMAEGAAGAVTRDEFVAQLARPRAIWLMIPAGAVDAELAALTPLLDAGDIVIDGGNTYYHDDLRRAASLREHGLHYVDVGTSGGIWGLERGYCLMIGGEAEVVRHLDPIFAALAPGRAAAPTTDGRPERRGTADQGYLHCGPHGAGHFVKMVHNGIEYGLMAAYAEGFNVLRHADAGQQSRAVNAETTPLSNPQFYQYDFDLGEIAELWRRGSVVTSWLLDLTAKALLNSPDLAEFSGHVADSGEGRWTVAAAIDEAVPVPVLSAALYARFASRGQSDFAEQLLSALRFQFGGHVEAKT